DCDVVRLAQLGERVGGVGNRDEKVGATGSPSGDGERGGFCAAAASGQGGDGATAQDHVGGVGDLVGGEDVPGGGGDGGCDRALVARGLGHGDARPRCGRDGR